MLGSKFIVRTDKIATIPFQTLKKLSPKRRDGGKTLWTEFNMCIEYKSGNTNRLADASNFSKAERRER